MASKSQIEDYVPFVGNLSGGEKQIVAFVSAWWRNKIQ